MGARLLRAARGRKVAGLTRAGGLIDAPRVRSCSGERGVGAWVLVLGLAGCNIGERGGEAPGKQAAGGAAEAKAAGGAAKAAGAAEVKAAGPGSCEATAAKLVELSVIEGKAVGREWSVEKQDQKREQFIKRCSEELPAGKVTRETLLCVEAASELAQAQACLLAATR